MHAGLEPVWVTGQGLLTGLGGGVAAPFEALSAGRVAAGRAGARLHAPALANWPCVWVPEADAGRPGESRAWRLAARLFEQAPPDPPADAALFAATTVGAVDRLEAAVAAGAAAPGARLTDWAADVARLACARGPVRVVSSACASSTAALALAASAIRRGELECALVLGCDAVTEFALSGFASLMALDPEPARPFDAGRRGIMLGEGAAWALLMSASRARREGRAPLGEVAGWGLTCDANHITGPSRDGAPLARAIRQALRLAGADPDAVRAVCAHGTGTVFNDLMEMKAFRLVFGEAVRPVFSVKGGTGHMLGAAGLAEALLALEAHRRGVALPTAGLREPDAAAAGWVSDRAQPLPPGGLVLSTNSGFGGTNVAVALRATPGPAVPAGRPAAALDGGGWHAAPDAAADEPLPRAYGRFDERTRALYRAASAACRAAGLAGAHERIGMVVEGPAGSEEANRAYFEDYWRAGRALGRSQLFVNTLPTTAAGECAIARGWGGPSLYAADAAGAGPAGECACRALLEDGLADALVWARETDGSAEAQVIRRRETGERA